MIDNRAKMETILEQMDDIGLTPPDFFLEYSKKNTFFFNLSDLDQQQFMELYDQIDNNIEYNNTKSKGTLLENLTMLVFEKGCRNLFYCRNNCRTSTNEMDVLIEWNTSAREGGYNQSYPCFGDSFICECKNYNEKVNVTYVGKFFSLLKVSNVHLGVLISWEGVTGRNQWSDALGFIKKVALAERIYIVVLDKNDLKEIYTKEKNIFSLVHEKYMALKNDVDYSKYIKAHEAEGKL